jgi:hypothetical protein
VSKTFGDGGRQTVFTEIVHEREKYGFPLSVNVLRQTTRELGSSPSAPTPIFAKRNNATSLGGGTGQHHVQQLKITLKITHKNSENHKVPQKFAVIDRNMSWQHITAPSFGPENSIQTTELMAW